VKIILGEYTIECSPDEAREFLRMPCKERAATAPEARPAARPRSARKDQEEWLTTRAAADMLGLPDAESVRLLLVKGDLVGSSTGGKRPRYSVARSSIEAFLLTRDGSSE